MTKPVFHFNLRTQELVVDDRGYRRWEVVTTEKVVPAAKTALIICDMWDNHYIRAARSKGARIIHSPSETMDFYAEHPARKRMLSLPRVEPPPDLPHDDPPLPVDDSDGGSDTGEATPYKAWTRQHPDIEIADEDAISDDGREVYSLLRREDIEQVLIMGVHTGMCILNRSFAIKQMVRWGVNIALVRDLTDALYNPERPPYVSHDEGTALIIAYIEKFWCPTVHSEEVISER